MNCFRNKLILNLTLVVSLILCFACVASAKNAVLNRWSRTQEFKDEFGGSYSINVTYYSGEYIEALVAEEAEKNLWTADELENYKYEMLKALQLDDFIPVKFSFVNRGPSMHMAPFDDHVTLWIGNKKYSPVNYDKRLNFKVDDEREGIVFFPKYDEKTGKPLLEGVNSVRLVVNGAISTITTGRNYDFIWDVARDDPQALTKGQAAERLEADRLIKRLQKLNADKVELQEQMQKNAEEISMIEARLEELQGK